MYRLTLPMLNSRIMFSSSWCLELFQIVSRNLERAGPGCGDLGLPTPGCLLRATAPSHAVVPPERPHGSAWEWATEYSKSKSTWLHFTISQLSLNAKIWTQIYIHYLYSMRVAGLS